MWPPPDPGDHRGIDEPPEYSTNRGGVSSEKLAFRLTRQSTGCSVPVAIGFPWMLFGSGREAGDEFLGAGKPVRPLR